MSVILARSPIPRGPNQWSSIHSYWNRLPASHEAHARRIVLPFPTPPPPPLLDFKQIRIVMQALPLPVQLPAGSICRLDIRTALPRVGDRRLDTGVLSACDPREKDEEENVVQVASIFASSRSGSSKSYQAAITLGGDYYIPRDIGACKNSRV
jgi:hypothetical protein